MSLPSFSTPVIVREMPSYASPTSQFGPLPEVETSAILNLGEDTELTVDEVGPSPVNCFDTARVTVMEVHNIALCWLLAIFNWKNAAIRLQFLTFSVSMENSAKA